MTCLRGAGIGAAALLVVAAWAAPPRELQGFDPPPTVTSVSAPAADQNPQALVDGNPGTGCMFAPLQGAVVELRFAAPTAIRTLGLVQAGWDNWDHPRRLRVTVGDGPAVEVELRDAARSWGSGAPGEVQGIPIGRTVQRVRLEVVEVYSQGYPWGSPGELGIATYMQRLSFGSDELPSADPRLEALKVRVGRHPAGPLGLVLTDADGNAYRAQLAQVPETPTQVVLALSEFKRQPGAFRGLDPYRLTGLTVDTGDPDAWADLRVRLVNAEGPEPGWRQLPPIPRREKVVEGKVYTEGLSATSVGRFGNSLLNGLLTETVEGLRFRVGAPRPGGGLWDAETFELAVPGATGKPEVTCEPGFAAARLKYCYPGGATVTQHLNSMTPGFVVELNRDRLGLKSSGAGSLPRRSGAPNEPEAAWALRGEGGAGGGQAMLLWPDAGGQVRLLAPGEAAVSPAEPWCVAVYGCGSEEPTLAGDQAVAVLLTFERRVSVGWSGGELSVVARGRLGKVGLSATFAGLLGESWDRPAVARRARELTRLLHTFPVACTEWYRVEAGRVEIVNEFSYLRWGDRAWQAEDYAPVPPLYAAGPHPLVTGTDTGITTRVGPYVTRPGSRLTYSLPVPAFEHAALPLTGAAPDLVETLRSSVAGYLDSPAPGPAAWPWQPTVYDGWTAALSAATVLTPESGERLLARGRQGVEMAFHPRTWLWRQERFSGRPYVATGWFDRSVEPPMLGDPNSAAGSALYALYVYALHSGDEETVRQLWPAARDITRFLEVVNDWAVPQTSSREAANFSNIDMDTITHLGLGAYWWLAQRVGTATEAERAAYLYAKVAPVAALRLIYPRLIDPQEREPQLFCDGFTEEGPAMRLLRDDMVTKDCVAMCLSWCGQQTEMYRYLMDYLGDEACRKLQAEVIEKRLPGWREMVWNRSRIASHLAQRAWLPDWPAADVELGLEGFERLMGQPSKETAELVALLQARGLPSVADWWPKRLTRLRWNGELEAELAGDRGGDLVFRWPQGEPRVVVDGAPVAATQDTPGRPVWRVTLPPGVVRVTIRG